MRKSMVLLTALSMSAPAMAGNPYVGIELGPSQGKSNDVDQTVRYRTGTGTLSEPLIYDDVFGVIYKRGVDAGLLAGYDFGWIRVEGELGEKRVRLRRNVPDDETDQFLSDVNAALNRPSQQTSTGGLPALTIADFQPSGSLKAASAMVNVVFDVATMDRLNVYAGGGIGRSFVRRMNDRGGARAYQLIAGARYAIGNRIELGMKFRRFSSGIVRVDDEPIEYPGNHQQLPDGVQTIGALVTPDIEGEFRTKSLLISLAYNFR